MEVLAVHGWEVYMPAVVPPVPLQLGQGISHRGGDFLCWPTRNRGGW